MTVFAVASGYSRFNASCGVQCDGSITVLKSVNQWSSADAIFTVGGSKNVDAPVASYRWFTTSSMVFLVMSVVFMVPS